MRASAVFAFSIVALCAWGQQARAADLGPFVPASSSYPEADPQYEFGTGWYLRGDLSYGHEDHPKLTFDGFDTHKSEWGYGVGGGLGYQFNGFLRFDITGDYLQPFDYSRQAGPTGTTPVGAISSDAAGGGILSVVNYATATINRYDGLINGYADLGTWYGVTPYIGAGVGVGILDPNTTLVASGGGGSQSIRVGTQTNFAWAGMAGLSYAVDPHAIVDIGYRHLDLGRFSATLAGYTLTKSLTRDEVRLGLRYMID